MLAYQIEYPRFEPRVKMVEGSLLISKSTGRNNEISWGVVSTSASPCQFLRGVHLEGSSLVWTCMLLQFLAMSLTDVHGHLTPWSACELIGWTHMLAPMGGASLPNRWLTLMHQPTTPSIATACNLLHEMKMKTLNELLNGGVWNFFPWPIVCVVKNVGVHSSQFINPFLFFTLGFSRRL